MFCNMLKINEWENVCYGYVVVVLGCREVVECFIEVDEGLVVDIDVNWWGLREV